MSGANYSRRELLRRGAASVSALALSDVLRVNPLFAAPGAPARNIVFVELLGGNDGYNTIVPYGVSGGAYYGYRPKLAVAENKLLKINGALGFHPKLKELQARFAQNQLAVVQGVGYPNPNFSHDFSAQIWRSGIPAAPGSVGWLGRYLSLFPKPSFPYAAEIGDTTTLLTAGAAGEIPAIGVLEAYQFPADYAHPEDSLNRRKAFEKMIAASATHPGTLGQVAATGDQLLDLIDTLKTVPALEVSPSYPAHGFSIQLQIVLRLLRAGLGMRYFRVQLGNFDTHAEQDKAGFHGKLLEVLSKGLDAFQSDLAAYGLADQTIVVVFSEFGRTLRENLSAGTDHGTINQVFVLGSKVKGGLVTPHPSLAPDQLDLLTNEVAMTTDFRAVFATVLGKWLAEPPEIVGQVFPGFAGQDLGFV
jgi:uncharacterized protein (DUF1501 family)